MKCEMGRNGVSHHLWMDNKNKIKDVEKIIHEFGKLQEDVSKRILTHYPSLRFPESLLPYKKEVIAAAMDEVIKIKKDDNKIVNLLKVSRIFLDGFIDVNLLNFIL